MKIKIEETGSDQAKLDSIFSAPQPSVVKNDVEEEEDYQEVKTCWICSRDRSETSDFYCDVHYCGEECRQLHHPADHEEPWPVVVKYKPSVGRLLIAARDIDQGELIFTEECFTQGPNHTLTKDTCLQCLKEVTSGTESYSAYI